MGKRSMLLGLLMCWMHATRIVGEEYQPIWVEFPGGSLFFNSRSIEFHIKQEYYKDSDVSQIQDSSVHKVEGEISRLIPSIERLSREVSRELATWQRLQFRIESYSHCLAAPRNGQRLQEIRRSLAELRDRAIDTQNALTSLFIYTHCETEWWLVAEDDVLHDTKLDEDPFPFLMLPLDQRTEPELPIGVCPYF